VLQAIDNGGAKEYVIYDSRAVVFEKLGKLKDALKDARKAIEVAPGQWQGYARAARLFLQAQKFDSALKMADAALKKVKDDDAKRRQELFTLKNDISGAQVDHIKRTTNHWTHLPVELFAEISSMLVEADPNRVLPLSQVCKDWRAVVWGNPYLWTTLVLGRSRPLTKARRWIKLSNGHIHTLKVQAAACEKAGWDGEGLEGLRWDKLCVFKSDNWDVRKFWKSKGSLAPISSLVHYEFCNTAASKIAAPYDATWALEHVHLSNVVMPAPLLDLSEKSIFTLSLHDVQAPQALRLRIPQTLVTFDVDMPGMWLDELPSELPDLRHLKLRQANLWADDCLAVAMPHLETLEVDGSSGNISPSLVHLRSKSSGNLTSLTLKAIGLSSRDSENLIALLRNNPLIATLQLPRNPGMVAVVEALTLSSQPKTPPEHSPDSSDSEPPTVLCPMLTQLDLSYCNGMKTGPLVQLIRDRTTLAAADNAQKITSLILDGCDTLDVAWLPWFRSNIEKFSCALWTKKSGKFRAAN
jgi:hypothetical protein